MRNIDQECQKEAARAHGSDIININPHSGIGWDTSPRIIPATIGWVIGRTTLRNRTIP